MKKLPSKWTIEFIFSTILYFTEYCPVIFENLIDKNVIMLTMKL